MGNSCDKVKHFKDQNFSSLQSQCRKKGEPFKDPQFEIYRAELLPRGQDEIRWLRPAEICQNKNEKPEFLVGSQDR